MTKFKITGMEYNASENADPSDHEEFDYEFEELYNESMELLDYMNTLPGSSTVSEVALFNRRMRYVDSIIHEMKILNVFTEA